MKIVSTRLELVLKSHQETLAMLDGLSEEERQSVSPEWLKQIEAATEATPWVHGFTIVMKADGLTVGNCGFKGPPNEDGMVEIAYGVDPEFQNRGIATEAAASMTQYAFSKNKVRLVRAHTLPEENASTRVLTKCGFEKMGEVIDPEDGKVWRWQRRYEE